MYIIILFAYNINDLTYTKKYVIIYTERGGTMNTINITNARQNLFQLVSDVNIGFNPITIVNNKGKNAVLISEDEWKNIEETLYLSSIPGLVDDVNKIRKNEDWKSAKEYEPDEEYGRNFQCPEYDAWIWWQ